MKAQYKPDHLRDGVKNLTMFKLLVSHGRTLKGMIMTSVWQMTAEVIPIKYGLLYSLLRKLAEITAILRQTLW